MLVVCWKISVCNWKWLVRKRIQFCKNGKESWTQKEKLSKHWNLRPKIWLLNSKQSRWNSKLSANWFEEACSRVTNLLDWQIFRLRVEVGPNIWLKSAVWATNRRNWKIWKIDCTKSRDRLIGCAEVMKNLANTRLCQENWKQTCMMKAHLQKRNSIRVRSVKKNCTKFKLNENLIDFFV